MRDRVEGAICRESGSSISEGTCTATGAVALGETGAPGGGKGCGVQHAVDGGADERATDALSAPRVEGGGAGALEVLPLLAESSPA